MSLSRFHMAVVCARAAGAAIRIDDRVANVTRVAGASSHSTGTSHVRARFTYSVNLWLYFYFDTDIYAVSTTAYAAPGFGSTARAACRHRG